MTYNSFLQRVKTLVNGILHKRNFSLRINIFTLRQSLELSSHHRLTVRNMTSQCDGSGNFSSLSDSPSKHRKSQFLFSTYLISARQVRVIRKRLSYGCNYEYG